MFYKNISSLSILVFNAFILGKRENQIGWKTQHGLYNITGVGFRAFISQFFKLRVYFCSVSCMRWWLHESIHVELDTKGERNFFFSV